jgi:hypothetical protein
MRAWKQAMQFGNAGLSGRAVRTRLADRDGTQILDESQIDPHE